MGVCVPCHTFLQHAKFWRLPFRAAGGWFRLILLKKSPLLWKHTIFRKAKFPYQTYQALQGSFMYLTATLQPRFWYFHVRPVRSDRKKSDIGPRANTWTSPAMLVKDVLRRSSSHIISYLTRVSDLDLAPGSLGCPKNRNFFCIKLFFAQLFSRVRTSFVQKPVEYFVM